MVELTKLIHIKWPEQQLVQEILKEVMRLLVVTAFLLCGGLCQLDVTPYRQARLWLVSVLYPWHMCMVPSTQLALALMFEVGL